MDNLATVFNKEYPNTVTQYFKQFLDNDLYIDLIFVCRNNRKVGAHQIVMGTLSKLFNAMFLENVNTIKEKVVHVYVPDIREKIMKRILEFVYCGNALLSKTELQEFNEDIRMLGMPLDVFSSSNETNVPQANAATSTTTDRTNSIPVPPLLNMVNQPVAPPVVASSSVPAPVPHANLSSSAVPNSTPTPGMPLMVDAHSRSADPSPHPTPPHNENIDASRNTPLLPGNSTGNANPPNFNVSNSNDAARSNSSNHAAPRKRRKTDDVINLIDDDDNDDVITLS